MRSAAAILSIATAERQNDIVTRLIGAADLRRREAVGPPHLGNGPLGAGTFIAGSAAAHVAEPCCVWTNPAVSAGAA